MPRKAKRKSRYFLLIDERTGSESIPVEWDKLPDEVVEKCESKVIHDIKVYSKKHEIGITSVIFFNEIDSEDVEKIKQDVGDSVVVVEDTKNKVIYII